jgi:hypothetical protein
MYLIRGAPLDAPTYPPAAAFEQPITAPYELRLENVSLAELMKMPAAWDIVVKHMPLLKMAVSLPILKPHLGNMTVHSLAAFSKGASPEELAAIDQELARLPAQESAR